MRNTGAGSMADLITFPRKKTVYIKMLMKQMKNYTIDT